MNKKGFDPQLAFMLLLLVIAIIAFYHKPLPANQPDVFTYISAQK